MPIDRGHVAAYAELCGFPRKDTVPLTYPHLLAFALHLAIMTDASFPFPAIGTVHLENSHHPAPPDRRRREARRSTARAENLRPHAKGRVFDFLTDGALAAASWCGRRPRRSCAAASGDERRGTPGAAFARRARRPAIAWRLPGDLGRRYAAVSGDRNPIHLYPLTAKALGFPRQIAHGMWSKARCVAALENRLPDAVTVDVAFKKPILLPGTVAFGSRAVDAGRRLRVLADQPEDRRAAPASAAPRPLIRG